MRVSTLVTALLPTAALASVAASVSHTTSIATLTSTRTVVRVYTETQTGSPNATSHSPTGYSSWAGNATTSATGVVKPAQSTLAVYSPGATNAASRGSFSVALAALAGTAVYVLL